MTVVFKPVASGAAYLKGHALRLGNQVLRGGSAARHQVIDGYLLRAVRSGQLVVVTAIDLPTKLVLCDYYVWDTGNVFTGVIFHVAADAPTSRQLFWVPNDKLPVGATLDALPHRIGARLIYGTEVPFVSVEVYSRGAYSDSKDGITCATLQNRAGGRVVVIDRASANMFWFADTVTDPELDDRGIFDRRPSFNRSATLEFSEASLSTELGGATFRSPFHPTPRYTDQNSVFEFSARDAVVCAHTFLEQPSTSSISGLLLWRYQLEFPEGATPTTKPDISLAWTRKFDLDDLSDPLLKPMLDSGVPLPNWVRLAVPAFSDTDGMVAFAVETQRRYDYDAAIHYHTARGLVVASVSPVDGTGALTVVQAHSGYWGESSFTYFYTPILGLGTPSGARVVCQRARGLADTAFGGDEHSMQDPADLDITIVDASGNEIVVDFGAYWPAQFAYAPPAASGGRVPVGTYMHPDSTAVGVDSWGFVQSVCQYSEDVMAVVVALDADFATSSIPRHIAFVRISTGDVLLVRETGIVGDMYHKFALTCPIRGVGEFDGAVWTETSPGSLILTVSRESGTPGSPSTPAAPSEIRGVYISNSGGDGFTYCFPALAATAYFMGSPYATDPMRSASIGR